MIAAARDHALLQGLAIDYRVGSVEALDAGGYDLVTSLEVVEHVADARAFVHGLAAALAQGGLLDPLDPQPHRLVAADADPDRRGHGPDSAAAPTIGTSSSRPTSSARSSANSGLEVADCHGLAWGLGRGFHLSDDKSLDYFVTATRPA